MILSMCAGAKTLATSIKVLGLQRNTANIIAPADIFTFYLLRYPLSIKGVMQLFLKFFKNF
jgi:hypothetical protein